MNSTIIVMFLGTTAEKLPMTKMIAMREVTQNEKIPQVSILNVESLFFVVQGQLLHLLTSGDISYSLQVNFLIMKLESWKLAWMIFMAKAS